MGTVSSKEVAEGKNKESKENSEEEEDEEEALAGFSSQVTPKDRKGRRPSVRSRTCLSFCRRKIQEPNPDPVEKERKDVPEAPRVGMAYLDMREDILGVGPERGCASFAHVPDSSRWSLVEPEVSTEKSISTLSLSSPAESRINIINIQEDRHSAAPQRRCESCAEVPDSSHWVLVKPEVSPEESISIYSLSSPAGSYECSESGLRWSCAAPVILQYRFTDWHVFTEEMAHMQISQAGPLMDISLVSGELEEIHLPHFLCLGGSEASVCDAVRVLHGRDSRVCVEVCELTRHHARILHPSFSLLGLVFSVINLFSPKVHCELLLFCTHFAPLVLHAYLVPNDPAHIKAIHKKEKEKDRKGVWIDKPSAVGSIRMMDSFHVMTSCQSEIHPKEMNLLPLSTGNFCELFMKEPEESFEMQVMSSQHTEPIWTAKIRREDYCKPSRSPGQSSSQKTMGASTECVSKMRPRLIDRVSRGVLKNIVVHLQAHTPPVLNSWEVEEVLHERKVLQDQVSCLTDVVLKKGESACSVMLALLEELDPHLYSELHL